MMEVVMNKAFFVILLLCLLASSSALAIDDPINIAGFGKTKWGMSPEQVLKAETPRAKKIDPPEEFKGGIGLIAIDEIEIGILKLKVTFIFDESGKELKQANLTSYEKGDPVINAKDFNSLEKLLTEKYGNPTYKRESRLISWKLKTTTIELTHFYIPNLMTNLVVIYRPTTSSIDAARDL